MWLFLLAFLWIQTWGSFHVGIHGRLELVITHIGRLSLSLSLSLSLFKERTCSYGSCTWDSRFAKNQNWEVITKSKNPPTLVIYTYTNDK
jgi:hypothetical protein